MAKTRKTKTAVTDDVSLETLKNELEKANKIITKDGKVKKKVLKQYTGYQCNVCKKKFTNKYNLAAHKKIHQDEQHPCPDCPYVGRTAKYLARHVRRKHGAPRLACADCGRAFQHPCALKEHAMVHTGEKPLKCEVCGKGFRVSYSLKSHMLIHTNEKPFKCSFCSYACRDTSTLRKHENRHMGIIRTFPCKICDKIFDSKPKLKDHVSEKHLDHLDVEVKKYPCEECGKIFKLKWKMAKHVQTVHTPAPPCACPLCPRRVKHARYLPRHMRIHFNERPHACAHKGCGKAFKDKSDLRKHSKIHATERHAACPQCGAKFSRASRLEAHMHTHDPREKKVTCHYCHVKFYTKNYLINHIKQKHTGDKQRFVCDHCGLATFNKPSIVMHLKYGRCSEDLRCKICKTTYKRLTYLRSHYLKTHKMRYKPRRRRTKKESKPSIEIKMEPMDDPYEDVQLSLLEVSKEKIEIEEEEEEDNLENDFVTYSKRVLCEDFHFLLTEDAGKDLPEDDFDEFLLKHVFQKQVKAEKGPQIEVTDKQQAASVAQKIKEVIQNAKEEKAKKILERKKITQAKLLEKKLRKEAQIMRRKRRRERFELERVRQMYNERMKKAAAEAAKKEPAKKIKYFQMNNLKDANTQNESGKKNDSAHESSIDINKSIDDRNKNKENPQNIISNENEAFVSDQNTENEVNSTNELIDYCLENKLENIVESQNNNKKVGNVESEPLGENRRINDGHSLNNGNNNTNRDNEPNDKQNLIDNEENGTNDKNNDSNDKANSTNDDNEINLSAQDENYESNGKNDKHNDTEDDNNTHNTDEGIISNDNEDHVKINENADHDKDDNEDGGSDDDISDSDSNNEPNSEEEPAPSKKMKFQTHQCYVCFKLYPTKEDLLSHCASHFDICSSTTLSKCPACGHVVSSSIARHMRNKHGIHITIPHSKMLERDNGKGSKYCYRLEETVLEIIPSVKMLNNSAAIDIDKRNRERRDMAVTNTRLVKKGTEWIVEKCAADVSYQEMPEFTEQELNKVPVSGSYIERLGVLGRLARGRGVRILFPCRDCEKICQNFAALRLHSRRHDPNKKPFAPRKKRRDQIKTSDVPKVKNTVNRLAKPQPIKNNHKCDEELKKFYENNIRGADIEFWQFLKIYNKMERENIEDFSDLESRTDFGMHNYGDSSTSQSMKETVKKNGDKTKEFASKMAQQNPNTKALNSQRKSQRFSSETSKHKDGKTGKTSSKFVQPIGTKKRMYKRVIMISKKQRLEREKIKIQLRENLRKGGMHKLRHT